MNLKSWLSGRLPSWGTCLPVTPSLLLKQAASVICSSNPLFQFRCLTTGPGARIPRHPVSPGWRWHASPVGTWQRRPGPGTASRGNHGSHGVSVKPVFPQSAPRHLLQAALAQGEDEDLGVTESTFKPCLCDGWRVTSSPSILPSLSLKWVRKAQVVSCEN